MSSKTVDPQILQKKLEERDKARRDKFFLTHDVLGMTAFHPDVHSELFAQYIPFDPAKPFAEQSPIAKRIILWPRGHLKTSSIIAEVIQCILNFQDVRILLMQGTIKKHQAPAQADFLPTSQDKPMAAA